MKSPKWLREAKRQDWFKRGEATPHAHLIQISPDGNVWGWKNMATFLGLDERTLRKAYKEDRRVRLYIRKQGGRYYADPLWDLGNVYSTFMNRREGWPRKSYQAASQKRRKGRF